MNRKIAISLLSVLGALTLVAGSAFAAFTTTATAQSNTFSATTPSLLLSVDSAAFGNPVPGITVTGLIPGGPANTHTFAVYNSDADVNATQAVNLHFNNSGASTLPGGDTTVVVNCGQGAVSDTYLGWMSGHFIGNVNPTTTMSCTMDVSLNSGVPNSDAGLSDYFDAVFTGSVGL
jgi:hypothetical protein